MTQKVFGGEASLIGQVALLSGQDGYLELHWARFCASAEFRANILLYLNGGANIVPLSTPKSPGQPSPKQKIIKFYAEVFGLGKEAAAALKDTPAFKKDGKRDRFDLILDPALLPDQMIIDKLAEWKPIIKATCLYADMDKIQKLPKEHMRPQGSYCIRHVGGPEPDEEHRGKSYNDSIGEKMTFLTYREYLIASIRNLWETGYLFDRNGWTRLCSLWFGGSLVRGDCHGERLRLSSGCRDNRSSVNGPRSAVIL